VSTVALVVSMTMSMSVSRSGSAVSIVPALPVWPATAVGPFEFPDMLSFSHVATVPAGTGLPESFKLTAEKARLRSVVSLSW
jgi:hypothetical protein